MNSIGYLFKKSLSNLIKRPLSMLTSLVSLILLFLMVNIAWISHLSSHQYFYSINSEIGMELFLDDSVPDGLVTDIIDSVSKIDAVEFIVYISKDEARNKLADLMGTDLLEGIDINPLPRSIIVDFEDSLINSTFMSQFNNRVNQIDGINEIFYPAELLQRSEYSRDLIDKIIIFLVIVIGIAIVLNLLHAIRLSARNRHEELYQLRLLGAGKWFLSVPFIAEGMIYTMISSAASWLIVVYSAGRLSFRNLEIILPLQNEMIYFCIGATIIGILAGIIGIRRSL